MVFNRAGNIWFTAQNSNAIGLLDVTSGKVMEVKPRSEDARPYGIKMDAQDRPWVVLFGSDKLANIDPKTFVLKEISLPRVDARPRRLEIDRQGNIWYVDYVGGYVGRYRPDSGKFTEWKMPGESPRPYGTALDASGRLWIADTGVIPNRILGFDTNAEKFISASEVPSGGNVRHMFYHPQDNSFWFGVDAGYLARGVPKTD
jgi:virginiamycin B lyase